MDKMVLITHPHWDEVKAFTEERAAWVLSKGDAYKVVRPKFKPIEKAESVEGQTDAKDDTGNKSDSPSAEDAAGDSEGRRSRRKGKATQ